MKCHILFSGKNKKNIINLSSAENAQRVVKVKAPITTEADDTFKYILYVVFYKFCLMLQGLNYVERDI